MKKFRVLFLFIVFILIMGTQIYAFSVSGEVIDDAQNVIISSGDGEIFPVDSIKKDSSWNLFSSLVGNSLPSEYRLDDYIDLKFKNQMDTGECWSMSVCSMLETFMSKVYNSSVEYSSRHMNYATTSEYSDWEREAPNGGNSYIGLAYFVSGKGPVLESDFPFKNSTDSLSSSEVEKLNNSKVQKQINDYVQFTEIQKEISSSSIIYKINGEQVSYSRVVSIRNDIKNHIKSYGGVTAYTCGNINNYFNLSTNSAYCNNNEVEPMHQVLIIGWDDNYSKNNFKDGCRPLNDGAYIAMESYGTNRFDNGFIYISYDDVLVERAVFGIQNVSNVKYDNIYQYDELGSPCKLNVDKSYAYAANVYDRELNGNEYLSEVGLYINNYSKVKVYVSCGKDLEEISGLNDMIEATKEESSILEPGYHTIKLDNKIRLYGDKFVIIVKYISADNSNDIAIPIEYPNNGYSYSNAGGDFGESFFSTDGTSWKYYSTKNGIYANACIKGFSSIDSSYNYVIEGDYIKGVSSNLNSDIFKNNLISVMGANVSVNGISDEKIKTGDVVSVSNNGNTKDYTLIIKGDVDLDGDCDIIDLMLIKKYIIGLNDFENNQILAADVSLNGVVDVVDLSNVMRFLVKAIEW